MKKKLLGLMALGSLVLTACQNLDSSKVEISNFQQAQSYIEKGWLPDNLPESSYDIQVVYNLDTNQINGRFHVLESDSQLYLKQLSRTDRGVFDEVVSLTEQYEEIKNKYLKDKSNPVWIDEEFIYILEKENTFVFWGREN